MTGVYRTASEEETGAIAERFASGLPPGAVVLLTGDLGAGKTAFVRGMAAGLGIDPEDISSPTFTLIQEYRPSTRSAWPGPVAGAPCACCPTWISTASKGPRRTTSGLDELSAGGGVVAIEWAEKLASPPTGRDPRGDRGPRTGTRARSGSVGRSRPATPIGSSALPS